MSLRFVPVAIVTAFVALVAVGGAAFAIGAGNPGDEKIEDLLGRAASELGVAPEALQNALAQAHDEIKSEHIQQMLENLVGAGVITEEQADEVAAWLADKPAALGRLGHDRGLFGVLQRQPRTLGENHLVPNAGGLRFPFGEDVIDRVAAILGISGEELQDALQSARQAQAEDQHAEMIDGLIDQLVEDGVITPEEADEIRAWLDDMPEWLADTGVLPRLLSGEGQFGPQLFRSRCIPSGRGFRGGPHGQHGPFQNFRGLVPDGGPFFFAPEGGEFSLPQPRFGMPGDGELHHRFFFSGPEGEFQFDGQLPPEFEDLFERFGGGFPEGFEFHELDGLFGPLHGFPTPEPEHEPTEDASQTSA